MKESAKFDAEKIQVNREYTPAPRSYSQEFTKNFLVDPSIPDTEDMERLNGSLALEIEEIMPDVNGPFSGKLKFFCQNRKFSFLKNGIWK
jgi:hypothetical protein